MPAGLRQQGICRECVKKIVYIGDESCLKCGKPLDVDDKEYCHDCAKTKHIFDRSAAVTGLNIKDAGNMESGMPCRWLTSWECL